MMTISYEYHTSLYVNLTNRCDCRCTFCLRQSRHPEQLFENSLWLEREPTREEALDDLLRRGDLSRYDALVFCGFGEPMYRWDDAAWIIDRLRERQSALPEIRVNTNGHANRILGRDVTPELAGRLDAVSVSLNGSTPEEYEAVTRPSSGALGWSDMLDFTRKASRFVPRVVLSIVDTGLPQEQIDRCRALAESLGAALKIRAYVEN